MTKDEALAIKDFLHNLNLPPKTVYSLVADPELQDFGRREPSRSPYEQIDVEAAA